MNSKASLEKIVSLCKRRGFAFPSAEIYGGINGIYDFGPLGVALRQNLKNAWIKNLTTSGEDVVLIEGSLLGPEGVWRASGHVDNFSDPMVDCLSCKKRYRTDEIDLNKSCPSCGVKKWTEPRQFNMMFKTELGAMAENASIAYLRPETAQAIFINFKNVMTSSRVKIPFGIAQIGKAFRNEITPKQFLFRMREFEQMEMQFFCQEKDASKFFDFWIDIRRKFYDSIGFKSENIHFRDHEKNELAHYAKAARDIEYDFPFGWKEMEGIHNRSNFDLSQHTKFSGKDLGVYDDETKQSYIPNVIECSVGLDRLFFATLCDSFDEDTVENETRTVLRFHPSIAPVKAAVLPLSKKLSEPAEKIYKNLKSLGYNVQFDSAGSIGKLYRRQDEIGTPICFTYDFDSETDHKVTARNRDTLIQERISIDKVADYLAETLKK
ncbi:TPA: glycine--tRNA ligase [Candidatus Dependentiae bacterium]|nr:MAG: Glycine-tRNA ligase [candidate division TM6 bacterium GW2011_GWE2_31_21]KKP53549.1 MAG: Glycine-tRNA ligase [candidate division TM6 bacterium GW2011_GWF2_33_332]HBS48210.1 glycine--tRNA ligase [Candidatus Dependentiae bacterium]HBZ73636.1 glycine--tRNA ligase [Candidatus Dependentiae bacterium]